MNVFIVLAGERGYGKRIEGVFSTLRAAKECMEKFMMDSKQSWTDHSWGYSTHDEVDELRMEVHEVK